MRNSFTHQWKKIKKPIKGFLICYNAFMKNNKGFTLIELLVVISIIGVLATIVLASLGDARDRAKDAKIKALVNQFRTQAELSAADAGNYDTICSPGTKSGDMFIEAFLLSGDDTANTVCYDTQGADYQTSGGNLPLLFAGSVNGVGSSGSPWWIEIKLNDGNWLCFDGNGRTSINSTRVVVGAVKSCV